MEECYQDKIDMYLCNRMSLLDRLNFETELEQNPELQKQYQFTLSLQEELHDHRAKMILINSWKKEVDGYSDDTIGVSRDNDYTINPQMSRKRIWYRRIGWIAAVAFFILFFISLPTTKENQLKNNPEITQTQVEHPCSSSLFDSSQPIEVSSSNLTSPVEKLSYQQQERYWQCAQYHMAKGHREECVRYLRVLSQQEGIYQHKADSMLRIVFQFHQ